MAGSIFRDQFKTDLSAGYMNASGAIPGPGRRVVTDVESKIFSLANRLRGGGQDTPVWGDSMVIWTKSDGSGWARAAGLTLVALHLPEDTIVDADTAIGFATTTTPGDPRTDGFGWLQEGGGEIHVITPGANVTPYGVANQNVLPMQYLIIVALNDVGTVVMYSTFGEFTGLNSNAFPVPKYPDARVLWLDTNDTTATVYPYFSALGKIDAPEAGYPNGNSLEDVRIINVPDWTVSDGIYTWADRFTRADSPTALGGDWTAVVGTWGISSNKAYLASNSGLLQLAVHDSGLPDGDGVFHWDITMPDSDTPYFFCVYRYQDANNYYKITNLSDRNALYIYKVVGGAETQLAGNGTGINFEAGQTYGITAYVEDSRHRVFVGGRTVVQLDVTGADLPDATGIGMGFWFTPKAGQRFDNVIAMPHRYTLPSVIGFGKTPSIFTGGTVLAQDSFTDTDGTNIEAHTPEVGPTWVTDNTDWFISGGVLDPVIHASLYTSCVQELNTHDCECSVDVYFPELPVTDWFYGIVGRYEDADNWILARGTHVYYAVDADEVELIACIGGTVEVVHKVNFAGYFENGQTYTLKVQFKGDLVQVFLEGYPIISYYTTSDDPTGTKFGLNADHLDRTQEGGTYNNWLVKAI